MNQPPQLLVIKMSSLGDLFHARPAAWFLTEGLGCETDWVVHGAYADLVSRFPGVRRAIPFPRHSFLRDGSAFMRSLRNSRYDIAVDFQGLLKSAFTAHAARASRRIGCSFSREGSRLLFRENAGSLNKDRHAVEECMDVVRYLNLPTDLEIPPVRFPEIDLTEPGPRIGMAPASRWPAKNWPTANAADAIRGLLAGTGGTIYLLGGKAEQTVCNAIEQQTQNRVVNRAGQMSLIQMGSFLQSLDLVISVDTGPLHMAVATGTPVLGLYGPTDPARTGPYGKHTRVLTPEGLAPRPRDYKRTDEAALRYMREIRPERVVQEALDMLGARA